MKLVRMFLSIACLLLGTACGLIEMNKTVFGMSDVADFSVKVQHTDAGDFVTVSGLAFYSSYGVKRVESQIRDGHKLQINVLLALNWRNDPRLLHTFNYRCKIAQGIDVIEFGKNHDVIWTR